jgi:hypothetical protein
MYTKSYESYRKLQVIKADKDPLWIFNDGGRGEWGKPIQKRTTTGDCCVRSVSIASKKRYDRVWEIAVQLSYSGKPGKGMIRHEWIKLIEHFCEVDHKRTAELYNIVKRKPLQDVIKYLKGHKCRHIVELKHVNKNKNINKSRGGHLACVVGGKLYDTWDCKDMVVHDVFAIRPKKSIFAPKLS